MSSFGFTEITRYKKSVVISHNGNMGHTEDNVRSNFDYMHFHGAYDRLRAHPKAVVSGSPDYSFSLKIPVKAYDEIRFRDMNSKEV